VREIPSLENFSNKWQWIAEQAGKDRDPVLASLHRPIDLAWMVEDYRLMLRDGAPDIDGVTAEDYEAKLEASLQDLPARIKPGRYQVPPVRRRIIPKTDGSKGSWTVRPWNSRQRSVRS
jgi:hypothetical protein